MNPEHLQLLQLLKLLEEPESCFSDGFISALQEQNNVNTADMEQRSPHTRGTASANWANVFPSKC